MPLQRNDVEYVDLNCTKYGGFRVPGTVAESTTGCAGTLPYAARCRRAAAAALGSGLRSPSAAGRGSGGQAREGGKKNPEGGELDVVAHAHDRLMCCTAHTTALHTAVTAAVPPQTRPTVGARRQRKCGRPLADWLAAQHPTTQDCMHCAIHSHSAAKNSRYACKQARVITRRSILRS